MTQPEYNLNLFLLLGFFDKNQTLVKNKYPHNIKENAIRMSRTALSMGLDSFALLCRRFAQRYRSDDSGRNV